MELSRYDQATVGLWGRGYAQAFGHIRQRALAEEALREARRAYHRDTTGALARLEGLDVDGLPPDLAGQVFGQWAKTAARACRERGVSQPLRYAPRRGRGAVLTRHPSGAYEVVSAFGLGGRWQPGSLVGEHFGQAARPLT